MSDKAPDQIPDIVNHDVVRAMTDDAILYAFRYLESAQAQVLDMLSAALALADTDPERSAEIRRAAEEKSRFNENLEKSLKDLHIVVHEE